MVVEALVEMHAVAGAPLRCWHYGGDEAKNIHLGAGFQDAGATEPVAFKGNIDISQEDLPWAKSPVVQAFVASEDSPVGSVEELPSWFAQQVAGIVGKHGVSTLQAWQDGLRHAASAADYTAEGSVSRVRVNFWDTLFLGGAVSAADWGKKGFDVVLSLPDYLYLDCEYQSKSPPQLSRDYLKTSCAYSS